MKKKKDIFVEDIVSFVQEDFRKRQQDRKPFEAEWRLNNNFLNGNQFVDINVLSDLDQVEKNYYWQEREVYNHIAPIIESRLAKLNAIKPEMDIMPASSSIEDKKVAKLSQDILRSVYERLDISEKISRATTWSEITGTSFYKVSWNASRGKKIYDDKSREIREGDIEVSVLSPFEIFPDSSACEEISDCESIIHAKAYSIRAIKNIWGVDVKGEDIDIFDYASTSSSPSSSTKKNHAIVIERYESPSVDYPNGRLIVVCDDKLLYLGELPYINLASGERGFPFIKQVSIRVPGCFWGKSVINKIIPIQRAFNAVKNRKHEYMNRLSLGVLTVEDGSVDLNALEQEGLQPGKVIVYRQGANPPKFLEEETLPSAFEDEEESLLNEFSEISGVTNILSNRFNSTNLSGTALELLIEQDTSRLNSSTDEIDRAVKNVAKMILRLYKQFAVTPRLLRITNDSHESDLVYFKNTDLGIEDIVFMSDSTILESLSVKRDHILELLSSDVLKNKDGQIDEAVKRKVLEIFGINLLDNNTNSENNNSIN